MHNMIYRNILASAFKTYEKYNDDPYFKSVVFIGTCQIVHILLLLCINKKVWGINLFVGKAYLIFMYIAWMIILFRYFSKGRVKVIVAKYEEKPLWQRRAWGTAAIVLFVAPLFLCMILLRK